MLDHGQSRRLSFDLISGNRKRPAPLMEAGGDKKGNSSLLDSSANDHESSFRSETSSIQVQMTLT
jgi:hypothetical protein